MEKNTNVLEPLLAKAEAYGKDSFELLKLKALYTTSDVASSLISRLCFVMVMAFFVMAINIAAGLWIGDLLGGSYYGFAIVASFYALLGLILWLIHPALKSRLNASIIRFILR